MKNRKRIITLGLSIYKEDIKNANIDERISLQDYDILIVDPELTALIRCKSQQRHNDRHILSDDETQKYDENMKHWYREISDFLRSRKTIIILLNKLMEFYVPRYNNGIRKLQLINNYHILDYSLELINASGKRVKLIRDKRSFENYWLAMKEISGYEVYIESTAIDPLFTTQSGDRNIGGKLIVYSGNVIFLPYINILKYSGTIMEKNSKDNTIGKNYQEIFISKIIELDKLLSTKSMVTSAPKWTENMEYILKNEFYTFTIW